MVRHINLISHSLLRWLPPLLVGAAVLLGARVAHGAAGGASTVMLKTSVTLPERAADDKSARTVLLSDIAELSGADALALASTVIIADAASPRTASITLSAVRLALDKAGAHWGRITLSGSSCAIRIPEPPSTPRPAAPRSADKQPQNLPQPIDLSGPPTIRTQVARRVADLYNIDIGDLRLAFENADESLLSMPVADKRLDIQLAAAPSTARLPINVVLYDGDRVAFSRVVSAQALINRTVVTAAAPIQREQIISADLVSESRQWLPPTAKASATLDQTLGAVAANRLNAGEIIDADDVMTPIAAKRGELIQVRALSGPVTVQVKARALSQARDGELVQLKLDGSDRVFTARMSGRGRAVLLVDGPLPENPPRAAAADPVKSTHTAKSSRKSPHRKEFRP